MTSTGRVRHTQPTRRSQRRIAMSPDARAKARKGAEICQSERGDARGFHAVGAQIRKHFGGLHENQKGHTGPWANRRENTMGLMSLAGKGVGLTLDVGMEAAKWLTPYGNVICGVQAVQDILRGNFLEAFADGSGIFVGKAASEGVKVALKTGKAIGTAMHVLQAV